MWRDPDTSDVREYFGSLDKSVLALFMAMSGGKDWATYYESLSREVLGSVGSVSVVVGSVDRF
eukprot:10713894-Alexandrium_andersonii.AAC.1